MVLLCVEVVYPGFNNQMPHKDPQRKRDYIREYMSIRYYQRKAEQEKVLGDRCADCKQKRVLILCNKDPQKKTPKYTWSMTKERFLKALSECVYLCYTCSGLRKQSIIHGKYWTYRKHGCRCYECKTANSATVKRWKENSKLRKQNSEVIYKNI